MESDFASLAVQSEAVMPSTGNQYTQARFCHVLDIRFLCSVLVSKLASLTVFYFAALVMVWIAITNCSAVVVGVAPPAFQRVSLKPLAFSTLRRLCVID